MIDSGASKSCIDKSVWDALPEPKPVLNPTRIRFRVANSQIMTPLGVIHAPITFDDGDTQVKVHLPLFVCETGKADKCVLGSDAGVILGLKLDWAKRQLHFDPRYARKPLNCAAGRTDQPESYTARCLKSVVIEPMTCAGVIVGTRHHMPPRQWRKQAFAEATNDLWDNYGLDVHPGMMNCSEGEQSLCVINYTNDRVVVRKGTDIASLVPGNLKEPGKLEAWNKISDGEEENILPMDNMMGFYSPVGQAEFTPLQKKEVYDLMGIQVPGETVFKEPAVSTIDSDDDSMDKMHYPDVEPSTKRPGELPEALKNLLTRSQEGLTVSQQEMAKQLIDEGQGAFMDPAIPLVGTSAVVHYIDTEDHRPIRIPPRRVDPEKREVIEKEVTKMLAAGVIRNSNSPWSSPVVLVKKPDGSTRFCIDYRKLNAATRKNSYPLPRIDDHLDALRGNSWFCTLDLASGYWQIQMHEADKEKTAFASHMGLYEFNVMPFGLTNAPATFQALMEEVLGDLTRTACLLYLDDIIVYGRTFEEVYANLQKVMAQLRKYNLKLKAKKCSLFRRSVKFLGHVVTEEGIACNPETVQAVRDLARPKDKTGVRSILGLGNYYRRFIKDYCLLTHPLQLLTHLDVDFKWTEEHEVSLQRLKDALSTAPVLGYPNMAKGETFIVDTDASDYQIGGVLSQVQDGKERVIMYASKGFHGSQLRWCTTRRELWAIVHMVTKVFRHYLTGRTYTVRTDHASLTWIDSFPKNSNDAICRWIFYLYEVGTMKVIYRPGKKHGNADALSRLRPSTRDCPIPTCKDPEHKKKSKKEKGVNKSKSPKQTKVKTVDQPQVQEAITRLRGAADAYSDLIPSYSQEDIRKLQQQDSAIRKFIQIKEQNEQKPPARELSKESREVRVYCALWNEMRIINGILYRVALSEYDPYNLRLVAPMSIRRDIMERMHDSPYAGHPGMSRMKHALFARYYWPRAGKDIESWVRCCEQCAYHKRGAPRKRFPLIQEISGAPFHRVAFDIIGPLPETDDGNRYALVMVDYFTKWAEAYALRERSATTVAEAITANWFTTHGVPLKFHCDNAAEFRSRVMEELKSMMNIKGTFTTPYRAQSNGMCERTNSTIKTMIQCMVQQERHTWDKALPFVLGAYRATPHTSTGFSPNMLVRGMEVNLPCDIMYSSTHRRVEAPTFRCHCYYVSDLRKRMIRCHEIARQTAGIAAARQRRIHDEETAPRAFREGDFVWFYEKRLGSRPLCMGWTGVHVITQKLGPANYRIQRREGGKSKVVHVDNLRLHNDQIPSNWIKERNKPSDRAVQTDQTPRNITNRSSGEQPAEREGGGRTDVMDPPRRRSARIAARRGRRIQNFNIYVRMKE